MIRVERIEPSLFAIPASRILRESWRPPCLHYTPDYLCWQFGFPGEPESIGVAAVDGDEPIGFAATVPRRLRLCREPVVAHVLSFVAVRSEWRGQGIGALLYKVLLETVKETGLPIVAFAEPESAGRRLLLKSFDAADYRCQPLGKYRAHGCLMKTGLPPSSATGTEPVDVADFLAVIRRCIDPATLWNDPDRDQLDHYRNDPRGRALVLVGGPDGDSIGAAMILHAEILTTKGTEHIAMVESVFLPEPSADALQAVFQFAGERWSSNGTSAPVVVTAPNLWGVDAGTLRAARLRATPSCFESYLFLPGDTNIFTNAEGTNLEII